MPSLVSVSLLPAPAIISITVHLPCANRLSTRYALRHIDASPCTTIPSVQRICPRRLLNPSSMDLLRAYLPIPPVVIIQLVAGSRMSRAQSLNGLCHTTSIILQRPADNVCDRVVCTIAPPSPLTSGQVLQITLQHKKRSGYGITPYPDLK